MKHQPILVLLLSLCFMMLEAICTAQTITSSPAAMTWVTYSSPTSCSGKDFNKNNDQAIKARIKSLNSSNVTFELQKNTGSTTFGSGEYMVRSTLCGSDLAWSPVPSSTSSLTLSLSHGVTPGNSAVFYVIFYSYASAQRYYQGPFTISISSTPVGGLSIVGYPSSPTTGEVNSTSFSFHCNVPNSSNFPTLQTYVNFIPPYGGSPVTLPMSASGSDFYLTKTLSSMGNYSYQYKAVEGAQTVYSQTYSLTTTPGCTLSPTNTYPYPNASCNGTDVWQFYAGQCVSYVCWKVNELWGHADKNAAEASFPFHNNHLIVNGGWESVHMGNAEHWDDALKGHFTIDQIPSNGCIGQYDANENGVSAQGHVVYVECVQGNTITVSEFNYAASCSFGTREIDVTKASDNPPGRYIHIEAGGLGGALSVSPAIGSKASFHLFPNPATNTVRVAGVSEGKAYFLNAVGQTVFEQPVTGNAPINISSLHNGVYTVRIADKNHTPVAALRLIVTR